VVFVTTIAGELVAVAAGTTDLQTALQALPDFEQS
jgi:hypothetical protein